MAADFIVAIAAKLGEYALAPIGNPFGYVINYSKNIRIFRNQVQYLENIFVEIKGLVDEAKRNGQHILPHVEEWLTTAYGIIEESRKFLDEDVNQSCTDLVPRYNVSKKAKKKTLVVNQLLVDGKLERVSQCVPPPLWLNTAGNLEMFESRQSTFEEIMEALEDDDVSIIGVYGMGGIGKTTVVKEVARQASELKMFDEIVMAFISQSPNVRKIQGEIADKLGLRFEEESDSGRASRLFERLKQTKRVLLVLDDLWALVDLEAIGIPHGKVHKGCKLLFTSRSKAVCNEMNAQVYLSVKVLSDADAWNLFSKMAGDNLNTPELHLIATKVAKRCGGLPIAIVTVARALKGKGKHAWSDALRQLQSPPPKNIRGMQTNVYSSLELSFNFLETDESKSCFLLCSLFNEDSDIPVEYLARYGMGLRLFQNIHKLEEARDRTYTLVEDLKACCLLLDGKTEEYFRMHNVVRDFAILVASKGEHVSSLRHDARSMEAASNDDVDCCTAKSLVFDNVSELPDGMDCPKLEILQLQGHSDCMRIPNNFFEGMKALRVLVMSDMLSLTLPPSARSLRMLRTLSLERCYLKDISLIGELKVLEILSFIGSNIKRLPREIGQLTKLRLLDLTDCEELTVIPPKILSRLSLLESLYLMNSFVNWGDADEAVGGSNATLAELRTLSHLNAVELNILDVKVIPKDLLFEKVTRFKVYVGSYWLVSHTHVYPKTLKLRLDESISLQEGIKILLKQAQYLILEYCPKVLKNVLYDLKRHGFQNLKGLELYGNCDIEYLVDALGFNPVTIFPILEKLEIVSMDNMKEICQGHLPPRSFGNLQTLTLNYLPELLNLWKDPPGNACLGNLRTVYVSTCHKLKNLLSQHAARDFGHLYELCIFNCHDLQEVFSDGGNAVDDVANDIVLPKLKSLELSLLPEFKSFCPRANEISTSDAILEVPLFTGNVKFPVLEELKLRELPKVTKLWERQLPENNFGRLKILSVIRCHNISTVIPFNLSLRLQSLERLSVIFCDLVEEVYELEGFISADETNVKSVTLPPVKELVLCGLTKFQHLWWNKGPIGYLSLQNLNFLTITRCEGLKHVFSLSALKGLVQLQRLEIESCAEMKEIVAAEISQAEGGTSKAVFPHLHTLRLYHLSELTRFCEENNALDWPSLKILTIANCPQMNTFPASGVGDVIDQEGNLCATIQPLFSGKVGFPDTEELHIQWMENLVELWHDELPDQSLSRLQVLDVRGCDKLVDVGPTNMLPRLQMLSKLYIEDCGSLEKIFVPDGYIEPDSVAVSLSSLTELRLKSLPKLRRIWWDNGSQRGYLCFRNLSSIEISGCDHLQYIFSSSIAKGLVQLQRLKIDSCEMVREIVTKEIEIDDQIDAVVFPRIEILELKNLSNLVSFCSLISALHWPLLKELRIADCPKMRTFIPMLSRNETRMADKGSEEPVDLSTPPQPFSMRRLSFLSWRY